MGWTQGQKHDGTGDLNEPCWQLSTRRVGAGMDQGGPGRDRWGAGSGLSQVVAVGTGRSGGTGEGPWRRTDRACGWTGRLRGKGSTGMPGQRVLTA